MDSRSSHRNKVCPELYSSPEENTSGDETERTDSQNRSSDFKSESETCRSLPMTRISSQGGWSESTDDNHSYQSTVFSKRTDQSWSTSLAFARSSPVIPFERPSKWTPSREQKHKLLRFAVLVVFFFSLSSLVITSVMMSAKAGSFDCTRCPLKSTVHPQKAGSSQLVTGERDIEGGLNSSQVIKNIQNLKEELRMANAARKTLETRMEKMEEQFEALEQSCHGSSESQKSSMKVLWTTVNLTQKALGGLLGLWTEVNTSKKVALGLEQKLQMLTLTVENITRPLRGPPGPIGPPGVTGSTGPTGSGNFSLCEYKKLEGTAVTAGAPARRDVVAIEAAGYKIIGAFCDSNDAKSIMLSTGTSPVFHYKCTCKGTNNMQKKMKCFIHYWNCPLVT